MQTTNGGGIVFIDKVILKNYKIFRDSRIEFNRDMNIIVGDNETGKSTLIEAVNLALTERINGTHISNELSHYLFNIYTVKEYITNIKSDKKTSLPKVVIEVYFYDDESLSYLLGSNNSENENKPGIKFEISFNNKFISEYEMYISSPDDVTTIPIEFYNYSRFSFAGNEIKNYNLPKVLLINNIDQRNSYYLNKYVSNNISDSLDSIDNANLAISYRKLKDEFMKDSRIIKVIQNIKSSYNNLSEKDIKISTNDSNWNENMSLYLDGIPFKYIGKGEQNSTNTRFALNSKKDKCSIIMIEEPETNLSFTNMCKLVKHIIEPCQEKQLFINTHSSFIMNKIGIDKIIFINNYKSNLSTMKAEELTKETLKYFKRLPGYDTLRMIIASSTILVEGPSDELIVQRAYKDVHNGFLPIENGIDIISVRGLSFERFLEIAVKLNKVVTVVTDNDGKVEQKDSKYNKYREVGCENIKIFYSRDPNLRTLENHIVDLNGYNRLNSIFNTKFSSDNDMLEYMIDNKTECALAIFESNENILYPEYIQNAVK